MAADLPELSWWCPTCYRRVIPLAGRPKIGKSFRPATGGSGGSGGAFWADRWKRERVAYVALEDSPRRMRKRLKAMGASTDGGNLILAFQWPDMGDGGLSELANMLSRHKPRLVVFDTLRARSPGGWTGTASGATEALAGVQSRPSPTTARCCSWTITGRATADGDVVDDVMGSTGKSAVADVVLGLYRQRGGATRHCAYRPGRGRQHARTPL